jgi:hypothetical protein
LDPTGDNGYPLYSTCFRPDIPGDYQATLTFQLINTPCIVPQTTPITATCTGPTTDLSSVIIPTSVQVDRQKPTRVWLNATGVTSTDTLFYNWKIVYPTSTSRNLVDNVLLPVPEIVAKHTSLASFLIPQAGVSYVVELSVSDHCRTTVKNYTIGTTCAQEILMGNKTLAANYDGNVPVPFMSFAYDHTVEIAAALTYPKCQTYTWSLVDYSVTYSDSLYASDATEFSKTGGFAALISIVVIIAVIVPLVLWMYCTKKACFNKTDPRV